MMSTTAPLNLWFPALSIGLTSAVFGAFGAVLFVRPQLLAAVGVEMARPAAAVELRAFYGGLEVGLAIFFAASVRRPAWWRPALFVQVLTLGGAALARLLGVLVGGGGELLLYALMAAEAGGAAVGMLALRMVARSA